MQVSPSALTSAHQFRLDLLRTMLRLSTTLYLAATCLLVTSVTSMETVVTCDNGGNVQQLSCANGVIRVDSALYGRLDKETCSRGRPQRQLANTECAQEGTTALLKKRCDGKRECELNTNVVRRPDPCPGIFKYLETNYTCLPAFHSVTCENSLTHLYCDVGQVIFVYGADYGRHDRTTCIFGRPTNQIQVVSCSGPTQKVADSCNGKNSCVITARNSVFGDTCPNTYKYLQVSYTCEYPATDPEKSKDHKI